MIIVDLKKAFDILDHGVLLEKMKYFCFQTSVINSVQKMKFSMKDFFSKYDQIQ